jgi:oxalate decarboxylase/phosphoglucose isomerase-like protein (cupin superfamily)
MNAPESPRVGVDVYLEWLQREAIPVTEDFGVDLLQVPTAPWPRYGVNAAAVHLKGRGDFLNMFVFEIPAAGATSPQRHLYEEVFYVLEGSGSTTIETAGGRKHSFEWGPRSLFAIPLNAAYRLFNGSGSASARLVSTTNLPAVLNMFHDERFVFQNAWDFDDRVGSSRYFSGEGDFIPIRPGNHMWETNFVPDLAGIELKPWSDRGAGGSNIMFILADGTMHAHISEMPVGTYKKAHRHPADFHVMCVTGTGYSLLWYQGEKDWVKVDWKHGTVFAPPDAMFHQHFNTGASPARYLATAYGSLRYPFTEGKRAALFGGVSTSVKKGGNQIEYVDQDPRVHELFKKETAKNGVTVRMEGLV